MDSGDPGQLRQPRYKYINMTTSFKRQIAFALYTLALGIPPLAYALPKASSIPGSVALVTLG